jgi:gamma-glutamyltranspeptidase/glutathione hydrolase
VTSESPLPLSVPGSVSLPGVQAPRRGPAYGARYAVATDHYLASYAAMEVMERRGGNAADGAIAAAAVNCVTKPHRTQLGGDAFALVWRRSLNTVDCLNAGGRAPRAASLERFGGSLPGYGPGSVTVPGFVDALSELHITYATLPFDVLLAPAIRLAEEGFPVSFRLAQAIRQLVDYSGPETAELRRIYLKDGREPYAEGEVLRQPELAETLRQIVEEGRDGFYGGPVAEKIAGAMRDFGGLIDMQDLEEPAAVWDEPLVINYRGTDVYEQALPSQGIILLEALNIAENFPLADWGLTSPQAAHVLIEATKLAFADSRRYTADPLMTEVPVEQMLSKEHARARAAEIDMKKAREPVAATLRSETTEFVTGDSDLVVAFIQSVFHPWGSRFMVPGTGVLMNNRLRAFSADPASANRLEPGKRTVHTLNTFMAIRDGQMMVGGGTPGANFQVQCNLQTIAGILDWGLDLQNAIDAPRWVTFEEETTKASRLGMESRFGADFFADLQRRGHPVLELAAWDATVCRSQVIASLPNGGLAAASDLRGEGVALAL